MIALDSPDLESDFVGDGVVSDGLGRDGIPGDGLLGEVLAAYDLGPDPVARVLEVSENVTYRVDDHAAGRSWALRVHRPGYHTRAEILGELAWVSALRAEAVVATPPVVPARCGDLVVTVATPGGGHRHAVLFEWVDGASPEPSDSAVLADAFRTLGAITARLHQHARTWRRPPGFVRFAWTWRTTLGMAGRWGRWADGLRSALADPAGEAGTVGTSGTGGGAVGTLGADGAVLVGRAVDEIERRLAAYGSGPDRFGLVHADLRLANLLVAGDPAQPGCVRVIDFDDCGFSWYLYDLAASLSFVEHSPAVAELVDAWLAGYRELAPVAAADEAMIPTFVMLRRILLVAWLGTHPHSSAVGSAADYAMGTCVLADDYLAGRFLPR